METAGSTAGGLLHLEDPNSARLYCIVARAARRAIVFRRGPSKRVGLLVWNLRDDTLEPGQWFKGRIYERRCDLTPDGRMLVYFAASFRKPFHAWTALSRPPFLTALSLWPKGDTWGGGGLFDDDDTLRLNHPAGEATPLAPGFLRRGRLRLAALGGSPGHGEDWPIEFMRVLRDGWVFTENPYGRRPARGSECSSVYDPPMTRQKPIRGNCEAGPFLRLHCHGHHERQGRWNVETADIADDGGGVTHMFGRVDWADLDHNGDVLYAQNGRLLRLRRRRAQRADIASEPKVVADLNDMVFGPIAPPAWAQR